MLHPDDYGFTYASDGDWDRAAASELGSVSPDSAWVLTDRDCWYANPYYRGLPVPHPEDGCWEDEDFDLAAWREAEAARLARPVALPVYDLDEEIPF